MNKKKYVMMDYFMINKKMCLRSSSELSINMFKFKKNMCTG
jgi:hypothetical protein